LAKLWLTKRDTGKKENIMAKKKQRTYQQDMVGDSINSIQKVVKPQEEGGSRAVKYLLIGLSVLFLFVMLALPLAVVAVNAWREGWEAYLEAVLDEYTIKALWLTILATGTAVLVNTVFGVFAAFLLSKFYFRGRQALAALIDIPFSISPVIAGLVFILTFGTMGWMGDFLDQYDIKIVFAVPGVILATIFVTFPFVFRELFPVLNAQGKDEEEAAALMGAGGWTIFWRITFPHIKWALLYGVILCSARAMGEFGAVSVISGHLRGKTNTLPLHVEILYNEFQTAAAFAVSSVLVALAVLILIVKSLVEWKKK
jgi:sulfate transport system permease protein